MAKGTLHLNVELSAVADEEGKFGRLATLLGLADADHARGKCEHLWVACTRRGEADLPQWLVEQVLGEKGPAALVEAELASWGRGRGDSKTRRLRIGGAQKHCLWMATDQEAKHEQRSKGGKSQASQSSRQLDGKFAPRPAEHPAQSSSSEITSASEIPDPESLPPARDPAVPTPEPTPEYPTRHGMGPRGEPTLDVPAVSPPPAIREDIARTQAVAETTIRANPPPAPIAAYNPTDPRAIGRLAEAIYRRVSDARIALAAELGLPAPLPFPEVTPGSRTRGFSELSARIREEGALAPAACDRVLGNAVKQARVKRSLDWLGDRLFGDKAWGNARDGIDPSARPAAPARSGTVAATAPAPTKRETTAPVVVSAEELADVARMAREANERLFSAPGQRAPPRSRDRQTDDDQDDEQPEPRTET